jgi:hypothetical protein
MARNVEFRRLSPTEFCMSHEEAMEALEAEDLPETLPRTFGEVNIPGHSWHPCILNDHGNPSYYYDKADGEWHECPRVAYTEV